jgi:hypothetical protein
MAFDALGRVRTRLTKQKQNSSSAICDKQQLCNIYEIFLQLDCVFCNSAESCRRSGSVLLQVHFQQTVLSAV